jgi:hypothetical protein
MHVGKLRGSTLCIALGLETPATSKILDVDFILSSLIVTPFISSNFFFIPLFIYYL